MAVPDPAKGSKTLWPGWRWQLIGVSYSRTGFCAGWSCFSSFEPAVTIFGLLASQTVVRFRGPHQGTFAFFLLANQHGSCRQCQYAREKANCFLSQMICCRTSKPTASRPFCTSRANFEACHV